MKEKGREFHVEQRPIGGERQIELADRAQHRRRPLPITPRRWRETSVGQRIARVASIGRRPDVPAHWHVGRHGIEPRLVGAATGIGMLRHQLAVTIGPLGGQGIHAVVVVAVLGLVQQALPQVLLTAIVRPKRPQQLLGREPFLLVHSPAHGSQAVGHVGDLHPLDAGKVVARTSRRHVHTPFDTVVDHQREKRRGQHLGVDGVHNVATAHHQGHKT